MRTASASPLVSDFVGLKKPSFPLNMLSLQALITSPCKSVCHSAMSLKEHSLDSLTLLFITCFAKREKNFAASSLLSGASG